MDDTYAHLSGGEPVLSGAELAKLNRLLADPTVWVEAGADLGDRVVDAIGAARTGAAPGVTRICKEAPPAPVRRRRWLYSIVAVAAAAVVALSLAVGLSGDHQHSGPRYLAALRGTALAPGAAGIATLTKTTSGWEIYLDATGLPRRSDGLCYEAWLRNGKGVLVAVGTFNEAKDVRLWAGAPPTAYPVVTVTRQRVGDRVSSGDVVITGAAAPMP